jgi:hypothetical protein
VLMSCANTALKFADGLSHCSRPRCGGTRSSHVITKSKCTGLLEPSICGTLTRKINILSHPFLRTVLAHNSQLSSCQLLHGCTGTGTGGYFGICDGVVVNGHECDGLRHRFISTSSLHLSLFSCAASSTVSNRPSLCVYVCLHFMSC